MADQIRVNGNIYSWGSIRAIIAEEVYTGFTSISYGDKRERVQVYGMGRHHGPRGRTAGKYSTDPGKLGGPTGSVAALRARLAQLAADGVSFGNVEFQIVIQYVEPGSSEIPLTVELDRCVLTANTSSHEESADPTREEVEINYMLVRRNGLTLFDGTQGAP